MQEYFKDNDNGVEIKRKLNAMYDSFSGASTEVQDALVEIHRVETEVQQDLVETNHSAAEAQQSNLSALQAKDDAIAAASAAGITKFADNYAELLTKISSGDIVNNDVVKVFQDETKENSCTIYEVVSNSPVFKMYDDLAWKELNSFEGDIAPEAGWLPVPAYRDLHLNRQTLPLVARTEFLKNPANIELETRDYGTYLLSEWVQDLPQLANPGGADKIAAPVAHPTLSPMTVGQKILEQPVSVLEFSHLVDTVHAKDPHDPNSHLYSEFDTWRAAIQAALNYASAHKRKRVRIPLKDGINYLTDNTITVPAGVEVEFEDFITLADYTTVGGVLVLNGDGISLVNPMIDGSGIFAGGTGENGVAVISGRHIRSYGGVVKSCARGDTAGMYGGKAIQVEHSDASDVIFSGMHLEDCFAALSSIRDAAYGNPIDVEFCNFTAKNCGSLLLARMVNTGDFTGRQHVVRVRDFVAKNVGSGGAVIQYSRASHVAVLDGEVINDLSYPTAPLIAGSHLYCEHRLSYAGTADSLILLDRINDYTIDTSYPSNMNKYDISAIGSFGKIIGGENNNSITSGSSGVFKFNEDLRDGFFDYAVRNGSSSFEVINERKHAVISTNRNFIGSSNSIKFEQFPGGYSISEFGTEALNFAEVPYVNTSMRDYRENIYAFEFTDASSVGLLITQGYGDYTKIGRLVSVSFSVTYASNSSTENALIDGLPFAALDSGQRATCGLHLGYSNLGFSVGLKLNPGASSFSLVKMDGVLVTNAELSGKTISGVITYFAD